MKLKNVFKVFVLDAVFILGLLLVFAFLRKKITFYLSMLASYQGSLQALQPEKDLVAVQEVLAGLSTAADKTMWLLILAPIVLFLLYVVLQGLSFWAVHPRSGYLWKFALASLPAYSFLVLSLYYLWLSRVTIVIAVLLSYLTFLFYLQPGWKGWKRLLRKMTMIAVFLGYAVLGFFAFGFFLLFYLETLILEYNYGFLALGMMFLAGLSGYKVWMTEKFG